MIPAGRKVSYTVTYLEMTSRPDTPRPSLPLGPPTALIAATCPPVWYFLDLYAAVGGPYEWVDMFDKPHDELARFVQDPQVRLYTLMRSGWPAGFFMLDTRAPERCDLAYFGLVPEAVGLGLGGYLLRTAIHAGWDLAPQRMTVQTCSLDHPRALPLYQKCGFVPVGQSHETRVLKRPRLTPLTQEASDA